MDIDPSQVRGGLFVRGPFRVEEGAPGGPITVEAGEGAKATSGHYRPTVNVWPGSDCNETVVYRPLGCQVNISQLP